MKMTELREGFTACPCPKIPACEFFENCEVCIPRHYNKDTLPFCEREIYLATLTQDERSRLEQIYNKGKS